MSSSDKETPAETFRSATALMQRDTQAIKSFVEDVEQEIKIIRENVTTLYDTAKERGIADKNERLRILAQGVFGLSLQKETAEAPQIISNFDQGRNTLTIEIESHPDGHTIECEFSGTGRTLNLLTSGYRRGVIHSRWNKTQDVPFDQARKMLERAVYGAVERLSPPQMKGYIQAARNSTKQKSATAFPTPELRELDNQG